MRKINKLPATILVGFDGFIDTLYRVVESRNSPKACTFMTRMEEFSRRIQQAHGKSTNLELVKEETRLGGNGPILANTLVSLGLSVHLVGTIDHPIFEPLIKKCKSTVNLGPPGKTDAFEFTDGKILFGKHQAILSLDLNKVDLAPLLEKTDILAATNWTMLYGMTKLWKKLYKEIFPKLQNVPSWMFIDLADPAKRTDKDIKEALRILSKLQNYTKVVLGLNEKEAERISKALNTDCTSAAIRKKLNIEQVVIHSIKIAEAASKDETATYRGPFIKKPKITTGGGDNFNAGYIFGLSQSRSLIECLKLASHSAGYYIKHGKPAKALSLKVTSDNHR